MKKFGIVTLIIVALAFSGFVGAQAKASFSKDTRLVAQWFTDNANTQKFIAWANDNLSQEQIDSLQLLMFPEVEKGNKQVALELMKLQLQQLNMEKEGSEHKALYDAVSAALESERVEVKVEKK